MFDREDFVERANREFEHPRRVAKPRRHRGDCWLCDGTGRVVKIGCTKSVACKECNGSGWLPVRDAG